MKKIAVLLSLLVIVTTHLARNCKKEKNAAWYTIYNASIEIRTYYCFDAVGYEFTCERFNAKDTIFTVDQASQYCNNETDQKRRFCERPGYVNLLDNTIYLGGKVTCKYDQKQCPNTYMSKIAYWEYNSTLKLPQVHCDRFREWIVKDNNTTFIENEQFGLILTESTKYDGAVVWKTNHKDIIVSEDGYNTSNVNCKHYSNSKVKFKKISDELCRTEAPKKVPRIWYVYKYPTDLEVYTCGQNCNNISSKTLPNNNTKLLELCSKICDPQYCQSDVKLCSRPYKVNLETDEVLGLPGCKYSDGLCETSFWQYTNRCEAVRKSYENIEQLSGTKKWLNQKENGGKLVLTREGKLCGQTVWYTDQLELVASEKELGFYQAKSIVLDEVEKVDFSWFQPRLGSDSLDLWRNVKYYLMVPLLVCIFWIAFKFVVCPCYLCSGSKTIGNQKLKRSVSEEIELRRMRLALNLPIVDQDCDNTLK